MTHEIGIWFLLLSLFLPRVTLLCWWATHNLPYNETPFIADVFCSIFLPRILIMVFIYQNQGTSSWFWLHMIVMLVLWLFSAIRFAIQTDKKS